jgi:hypothetical protein
MDRSASPNTQEPKISFLLNDSSAKFLRAQAVARAANGIVDPPLIIHSDIRTAATITCVGGIGSGLAVACSYAPAGVAAIFGGMLGVMCARERLIRETRP